MTFPPFPFEETCNPATWAEWTADHMEYPVLAVGLYLLMIFNGPKMVKEEIHCKPILAAWNLSLSIFSIYGASRLVPYHLDVIRTKGLRHSFCENDFYFDPKNPEIPFWIMLFIYSKYAELMDTVFLVIRKKRVIFLHWFHHVTVLLYCQHAWAFLIGGGIWFAAMNYSVHSIMYMYYFLTNLGYYKMLKPIAPLITMVQILQMVGGLYVLTMIAIEQTQAVPQANESWKEAALRTCNVDPANWKMGLLMYFSYFILFCTLFFDKYLAAKPKPQPKDCLPCEATGTYGKSADKIGGAGFFHVQAGNAAQQKKLA